MSHTVKMKVKIKDRNLFKAVAQRLGLEVKENAEVRLFSSTHRGLAVKLPGWRYPIVVEEDGTLVYDNYDGNWGDFKELLRLEEEYVKELVAREARKKGLSVYTKRAKDGSLILEVGR